MADRYWVGGTGTWNTTSTANWSASSGGASGASRPTSADSVFFDQAGTYTVTMTGALNCLNITVSAGTVTFATGTTPTLTVSGSMSLVAATVWNSTGVITFNSNTTGKTVTTNGVIIDANITFDRAGGEWTLGSALTVGVTRRVTLTNGILALSTFTLTAGSFTSDNSVVRTIAFGTGNITVIGAGGTLFNTNTTTNLTTTGSKVVNVSYTGATAVTITSGFASTETQACNFNFTAGTYTLTASQVFRNLNFTGFAGTVNNIFQVIYGDVNLGSTATFAGGTQNWSFRSTSTGKTITTNGIALDVPLNFTGIGGSWILQDALTLGSTRAFTQTNGTLDLNGKTLTVGTAYTTAAGTKNLTFNGGTLICPATGNAFNNAAPTGYTTTAGTGTGTISMTAATAKTFVGGGSTFNCTLNQGGLGALTITGNNTFNNITNTVQPASVLFTAGTTSTFNNFNLSGTPGNLITITSTSAAAHTLSKASGVVSVNYLSISYSTATGGANWYAGANSVSVIGNTGWIFTAAPPPNVTLLPSLYINTSTFYLTSITQTGPPQPILGGGFTVKPRKKFRPAILFDFPEPEIVLPDVDGRVTLAGLSASLQIGSVVAKSPDPINSRAKIGFTRIEAYTFRMVAGSSWNDPSDEELLFILDYALD